jgi:hypothetical protein
LLPYERVTNVCVAVATIPPTRYREEANASESVLDVVAEDQRNSMFPTVWSQPR